MSDRTIPLSVRRVGIPGENRTRYIPDKVRAYTDVLRHPIETEENFKETQQVLQVPQLRIKTHK
jgi:hypothetical protein